MKGLERFFGKKKVEGEEAPLPDPLSPKIDVKSHKLRFYPGFDEFAALWNENIDSYERQLLVASVHDECQKVVSSDEINLVEMFEGKIQEASSIIASSGISKELEKEARRTRRRAKEQLQKLSRGIPSEVTTISNAEMLRRHDAEHVLSMEDRWSPVFYAAVLLNSDQELIDDLFCNAVARRGNLDTRLGKRVRITRIEL